MTTNKDVIPLTKVVSNLIESQCDNYACGTQLRQFLRDDDGHETIERELLRLNFEQFYRAIESLFTNPTPSEISNHD